MSPHQPFNQDDGSTKIYKENGKLKKEAKSYSKNSANLYQNHPLKLMVLSLLF